MSGPFNTAGMREALEWALERVCPEQGGGEESVEIYALYALLAALPEIKEAMAYVAAGALFDLAVGREEEEYCIRLECEAMERYRAARAVRLAKEAGDG